MPLWPLLTVFFSSSHKGKELKAKENGDDSIVCGQKGRIKKKQFVINMIHIDCLLHAKLSLNFGTKIKFNFSHQWIQVDSINDNNC